MKKLDFAAANTKTAIKIVKSFSTNAMGWRFQSIFSMFWRSHDELVDAARSMNGGMVSEDGIVTLPYPKSKLSLDLWVQGNHYMLSVDFSARSDRTMFALLGLVSVLKALGRGDYPVKVDKGDTITLKAAIAATAMAFAQGNETSGCEGIVMDMARDREI